MLNLAKVLDRRLVAKALQAQFLVTNKINQCILLDFVLPDELL